MNWINQIGTFSKTSTAVTGRRYYVKDALQLDYEFDSEAEWEEIGEGEALDSEEDEEEEESENEEVIFICL